MSPWGRIWTVVLVVALLRQSAAQHTNRRRLQAAPGSGADLIQRLKQVRSQNHVLMAPVEQTLIEQYLEPGHTMLEWGSGYSTLWLSQVGRCGWLDCLLCVSVCGCEGVQLGPATVRVRVCGCAWSRLCECACALERGFVCVCISLCVRFG